jgi:hypothetical protein
MATPTTAPQKARDADGHDPQGPDCDYRATGMIIALAVNSATGNDDINDLAGSVYQTLQNAGAVHTG